MSIFGGLKASKNRDENQKNSMNVWMIKRWEILEKQNESLFFKKWCKVVIASSTDIYEFLLDHYANDFKGATINDGLKEIVVYLAFNSLVVGGDPFVSKLVGDDSKSIIFCGKDEYRAQSFGKENFDSIDQFIIKVGHVFDFNIHSPAYKRFELYMRNYLISHKTRNLEIESQFLLFGIINETNAPVVERNLQMEIDFHQNILVSIVSFNQILKQQEII